MEFKFYWNSGADRKENPSCKRMGLDLCIELASDIEDLRQLLAMEVGEFYVDGDDDTWERVA